MNMTKRSFFNPIMMSLIGVWVMAPTVGFVEPAPAAPPVTPQKPGVSPRHPDQERGPTINDLSSPLGTLTLEGFMEPIRMTEVKMKPKNYTGDLIVTHVVSAQASVKTGEVLIACDPARLLIQLRQAERELDAAQASFQHANEERGFQAQTDSLALGKAEREARWSQQKLKHFQTVEHSLSAAESASGLREAEDSLDNQKEELDQLIAMYKSEELANPTAEIIVRRTRRGLERSQTRYQYRLKRHDKLITQDLPIQLQQLTGEAAQRAMEWEQLQRLQPLKHASKTAELLKVSGDVVRQKEKLKELQADLDTLTVKSSLDGAVYYGAYTKGRWEGREDAVKTLKPGEKITAGTPLLTVVSREGLRVRTAVAEADWSRVKTRMTMTVTPVAFPDIQIKGRVEEMIPIFTARQDGSRWGEAVIVLDQSDDRLLPGFKVRAAVAAP